MRINAILVAALIGIAALAGGAFAANAQDLKDTVPGHPTTTYFDLLKQVVTDLAMQPDGTAQGKTAINFRDIYYGEEDGLPATFAVSSLKAQRIKAGGKARLLVLADLGESDSKVGSISVLALYDDSAAPKLLDAADVGVDKFTVFNDPALLDLSHGDQAILTSSDHFNSDQDFLTTLIMMVRADKLVLVDSVSSYTDKYCSYEMWQTPSFDTLPDPHGPFRQIRVRVRDKIKLTHADCEGVTEKRPHISHSVTSAVYRWNEAKQNFIATSSMLKKKQEKMNEEM